MVVPLSLVACIFACLYGWVFVNTQRYIAEPGAWQRCIVYNVNQAGATPQNFAVRSVSVSVCPWVRVCHRHDHHRGTVAVAIGPGTTLTLTDRRLRPTPPKHTHSASAFGGVMFIFMGLGFKAGYLGMHDPDLLPYSLCKLVCVYVHPSTTRRLPAHTYPINAFNPSNPTQPPPTPNNPP